ncbi:hypothetical protein RCH16_003314 [Cryobacterium sp. MP_M5]|uniref:hypothetical protein n=1 Tax=unclassified Cryobacterium TaxID=2649013 RepID=UPI0018C975F3|nr:MULTISPECIES: hypothetical protein [unclassified Cryobacterium]MBG6058524.1 hypothetical protein [Cryobacterium sp. MP_M3]MEC5178276.1 hypothetical protein [Cryobacterium sp. MP_M5]
MQSKFVWPILVVAAVLAGASIPLFFDSGFYYVDDSQSGAFGQWYEIGRRVLDLDWSLINPRVWQSGNYLAEGAWGILSPVLWVVGIGAHLAASALIFSTIIKLLCLLLGALGVYALARNFGAQRPWAALVAVAAPLAGFTLYMDAPSWANGLMAWSFLPLTWVLARRAVLQAKSPVLPALSAIGLVGIGYAHATIFLAISLGALIVEAVLTRHRPAIVRSFALATAAGSFAVIVHLPGLLTAPVTGRTSGVVNTDLLTVNLSGLFSSATPVGTPSILFFSGQFPYAPLLYIAWFLPLLAFVDLARLRALLRHRLSIGIVLVAALVGVLLPSDFGPLRFPVRMMPYLTLAVLLLLAVGLSHARPAVLSRARFLTAGGLVLLSAGLTFSSGPQYVKVLAVVTVVLLIAVWVSYRILGDRPLPLLGRESAGWLAGRGVATVAGAAIVLTVLLLVPQHVASPASPLPDYGVPNDVSDYQSQLESAEGDVIVVGGVEDVHKPDAWNETLVGNLWYVTGERVQNAYSAVYYTPYNSLTCMQYNGSTCGGLYSRLFTTMPETGKSVADLMGVSSVQAVKGIVPAKDWSVVPDGWHVAEDTAKTRLIVRDEPVAGAGSVVWTSKGTKVTVLREDAMGVSFRVDAVGPDGGRVALSRIPWPGYQVDGGAVSAEPVDTFLLGVDVDAAQLGKTVTVAFYAPGYPVQLIAAAVLLLILLGWPILRLVGRRRPGRGRLFGIARASRDAATEATE